MENSEDKVPITLEQAVHLRCYLTSSNANGSDFRAILIVLGVAILVAAVVAFFVISNWFAMLFFVGVGYASAGLFSSNLDEENTKFMNILKASFDNKDSYEETVKKLKLWD